MIMCYFILGACLASFGDLVAVRLGQGQTPWSPSRSYCDHCRQQLTVSQLIPIAGWLIQRGHCWHCGAPISPYWPLSEVLVGVSAALLCGSSLATSVLCLLALTCLTILATTDFFYQFIYPLPLLGLLPLLALTHPQWSRCDILLAALFLATLLVLVWGRLGLGAGDFEFLTVAMVIFGCPVTAAITALASTMTVLCFLFSQDKGKTIPFVPSLALATVAAMVLLKWKGALA